MKPALHTQRLLMQVAFMWHMSHILAKKTKKQIYIHYANMWISLRSYPPYISKTTPDRRLHVDNTTLSL